MCSLSNPLYDIHQSYLENAEKGPFFSYEIPERIVIPEHGWMDFLNTRVATPIGIPAGPLLNSRWISLASDLGYDLLWYKTIRSHEYAGHALPNVIYVDVNENHASVRDSIPSDLEHLAITNSFGMPSRSPEYLAKDIPLAQKALKPGQALIVSVVGTPDLKERSFTEDFVYTALLAKECGATLIEANYSCPNLGCKSGSLYLDPEAVFQLTKKLAEALMDTPLIIKMGTFPNEEVLSSVLEAAARGGARAVAGINSVGMQVTDKFNKPALGEDRVSSGICGSPIRPAALDFTRKARQIIHKNHLDLTLIGGGGITLPDHFDDFFEAGADIAVTATGMMWDPYLAYRYHLNQLVAY